ncbi:MAG TPA: M20/M25/M40 family metallo-hydrolase [Chitinophagaceae bacterium]|nr:M20/M25/M40 family metallo-hydrolase [Chitinophagaceae bacterium]
MRKIFTSFLVTAFLCPLLAGAQTENIDTAAMSKIRAEGLNHSQVMDIIFHLTDVSGPRLTSSPGFFRAANYAKQTLAGWGLQGAMLDPWGDFGKSWQLEKSYLAITAPYYRPINAFPKAWVSGTSGLKSGDVLLITAKDSAELQSYKGKLKGKILILDRTDEYNQSFKPDATRYTDEQLEEMANAKPPAPLDTAALRRRREMFANRNRSGAFRMAALLYEMAKSEGAIAILSDVTRGHDGTIFVQGGGSYKITDPENFTDIEIGLEDYNSILRLLKANIPVKMDADVKTKFYTDDTKGYNVIAEIPGTDPTLKDEVVMLGAHLDSWHGATGATDNAAGSAVMLEAIRILKATGLQPKRTIRIGLWSGEEEGLLGSRGYVKKTFGDPATMQLTPAHAKFSAYFNVDNGSGKIRGIYLQGNEACRQIFEQWFKPFNDLGAKTITISNTGGTDHLSFDAVGLPGFQFIQDPLEYDTRTHHSTMDSYDHLVSADLKQMATIVAAFVYDAAQREEKLPRKELPKANPNGRGF